MRGLQVVAAFAALIAILGGPATAVPADVPPDVELAARLQAEVAKAFKAGEPGATVIVVRDGQVLLRTGIGMANLELSVPLRPEMIFRIGSVTKQFTAVSILMLAEQGKVSLDDEITKFLPDYPTQGQKITIEALLTHTAGITNYTDMPEFWPRQQSDDLTPPKLIDVFKEEPMDFQPGKDWRYSNSGYVLLGAVIEKASGQSYADFVEQHIFKPIGMTHSSFERTSKVISNRVAGYKKTPAGYANADYISMSLPYSAGSLLSTVDDLAIWDAALYGNQLVSQESLRRAWTSFHVADGRATHYGYGWRVFDIDGLEMVSHGGGISGFSCMVARVPESRVFVAVLTNREGGDANLTLKLATLASGREWHDPVSIILSTSTLDRLTGIYQLSNEQKISITRSGSTLLADLRPYGKIALTAVSPTQFIADADPLVTFTFQSSHKRAVESLFVRTWRGPDDVAIKTDESLPTPRPQ